MLFKNKPKNSLGLCFINCIPAFDISLALTLTFIPELAVHDVVNVKVTSNEDIWAIKILNLLTSIQVFFNEGTLAREIPIFGSPFDDDVFVVGLIDEMRFDPQTFVLELWELKTRKRKSVPSKSQSVQHRLQVMLYKKLFDDLVKGNWTKESVAKHLRLDLDRLFGEDIQKQIETHFLSSKNLNELLDIFRTKIQCMTCVQTIGVEYVYQETKETIGYTTEMYDENELKHTYKNFLQFWQGSRNPVGVDIEEAWKCQSCDFADICDWRREKAEEYSRRNQV